MNPFIGEPSRKIPVAGESDVLVCGGGPAGVAAALTAARLGANTVLLEASGCLGGVWTAGRLSYVLDCGNKTGLIQEIKGRHAAYWNRPVNEDESHDLPWVRGSFYFDPEVMKWILEDCCATAGVRLQYHTRLVAANLDSERSISAAISESKSGRQAWKARVYIDATGDGDFAAQAGCNFDLGHPDTGATQPMSLVGLVTGIREDEVLPFLTGTKGEGGRAATALLREMERAGLTPSYTKPLLARIQEGLFAWMANHAYGFSSLDADQVTQATLEARREVHRQVLALRGLGGPWRGLRLVASGEQIGVREGRRIHGRYQVTTDDLLVGRRHRDAVCHVTFPVDVHATRGEGNRAYSAEGIRSQPYDIPLRALLAAQVDNLLLAGRCISGDFLAHASYRVTGNAVPLGEAAGAAAALAASANRDPSLVDYNELQERLASVRFAINPL